MKIVNYILLYGLGVMFMLSATLKVFSFTLFSQNVKSFCFLLGMSELSEYSAQLSMLIIFVELLSGACVFFNRTKGIAIYVFPVLLSFFTYVTLINYTSPYGSIESCGCFGELIHFTPAESFYKNIVLLFLSILLLVCHQLTDIQKK